MKTRFFQVVWVVSVALLLLVIVGGIRQDTLLLNLITFGWPSIIGVLSSFIATGTLFLPREKH